MCVLARFCTARRGNVAKQGKDRDASNALVGGMAVEKATLDFWRENELSGNLCVLWRARLSQMYPTKMKNHGDFSLT